MICVRVVCVIVSNRFIFESPIRLGVDVQRFRKKMNLFDGALFGNHENGDPYWMLTMSIHSDFDVARLWWKSAACGGRAYTRSTTTSSRHELSMLMINMQMSKATKCVAYETRKFLLRRSSRSM